MRSPDGAEGILAPQATGAASDERMWTPLCKAPSVVKPTSRACENGRADSSTASTVDGFRLLDASPASEAVHAKRVHGESTPGAQRHAMRDGQ
jgi:hypothetical protein